MKKLESSPTTRETNLSLPQLEEKILAFWEEQRVFEKVQASKRKKKFIFYEGPPTANAGPGFHHVIARAFKDIICRYRELKGFSVLRKAGWDTHGLPVELQVEKQLGLKSKTEIESFGVAKFNQLCQKSVWEFKQLWDKFTKRIGFWLDLENPYITYDPKYIESCWWILKKVWEKGLLEKSYKVVPYCSRCGTALASHEVAQGYQEIEETSVYLKFKVKKDNQFLELLHGLPQERDYYFLAWTTTPWTLPGNVALAVHPELSYLFAQTKTGEVYLLAKNHLAVLETGIKILKEVRGKELVGLRYEPLFYYLKNQSPKNIENAFKLYPAEFATEEEGTGIVHTAVMYGEEDFQLGKEFNLPFVHTVGADGRFNQLVSDWAGLWVKEAEPLIRERLKQEGKLLKEESVVHTYPFCWRCHTPLLYYARDSWFIKMTKVKEKLIANNQKIHWEPEHLKEGRFGEWLREMKDWALSRERYWGTPLPIWVCENDPEHLSVVGSLMELRERAWLRNDYGLLRHGEAESNQRNLHIDYSVDKNSPAHLTEAGRKTVEEMAEKLVKTGQIFELIVASDLTRIRETVEIVKRFFPKVKVLYDKRLRELDAGVFNGQDYSQLHRFYSGVDWFKKRPDGGESFEQVYQRAGELFLELERKNLGRKILIISHGAVLRMLLAWLNNLEPEEVAREEIRLAELRQFSASKLPTNEAGEVDLHRPYVDEVYLRCPDCGRRMTRQSEVIDVWFDSGAMPLAQFHFPFAQLKPGQDPDKVNYRALLKKNYPYPADYISEAIDQTRGWFYTLLAISTVLELGPAYLNVVSLGHVLDAKGEKMSKSKGNIVDPWEMINRYGVDALRWYFYTVNSPGGYKRFAEQNLKISAQELMTVVNVLRFFEFYAPETLRPSLKPQDILDEWILERLAVLAQEVDRSLSHYNIFEAARAIQLFIDELSRWYLRRSRRKFQKPSSAKELQQSAEFLGSLLLESAKILAPFTPFLADYLWQRIVVKFQGVYSLSVHLDRWPSLKPSRRRARLVQEMEQLRKLAELGLSLRAKAGIKVRQPLKRLELCLKQSLRFEKQAAELLQQELNLKQVVFVSQLSPKGEGWVQGENEAGSAALEITLTPELKQEGWLRELIRLVQELRQEAGLRPQDQVKLYLVLPAAFAFLKDNLHELQQEVGAVKVELLNHPGELDQAELDWKKQVEIEGNLIQLGIKR